MEIHSSIDTFLPTSDIVLTLGVFDGVHAGHRQLIMSLDQKAQWTQSASVLLSFDPHPREVLQSDLGLKYLTTSTEKIRLLGGTGLQHLIIHPFTEAFAALSSEDFVRDLLLKRLRMKSLIIGHDHRIGQGRQGSYQQLKELAAMYGFELEQLSVYKIGSQVVSSTEIRKTLLNGNLSWANQALGYPYVISGRIVQGDRFGRKLGFPTANVQVPPKKLLPRYGVYAVKADLRGQDHMGMLNVGIRPTVGGLDTRVEVHLFDFDEIVYNEVVFIQLIRRIREEKRFDTLEALKVQLQQDEKAVRVIFADE
ncbi:MAG: bifunctional riboflavin kinase/FAD synthetase [Flavobacteriales bacterium AspAUS03]